MDCRIAPLLFEIEEKKTELGVLSYGLSNTTLEEVFLKVSSNQGKHAEDSAYSVDGIMHLRLSMCINVLAVHCVIIIIECVIVHTGLCER